MCARRSTRLSDYDADIVRAHVRMEHRAKRNRICGASAHE